jgi:hypothetical protein
MGTTPPQLTGGEELPSLLRDPVVVVESTAAVLAIVLAMTLAVASVPEEPPTGPAARRAPPVAAGTPAATTATTGVVPAPATAATRILPGGPGFESDPRPAGWQAVGGARVERVGAGREGRWAASVERGTSSRPGIALPRAGRGQPYRSYVATVWLRSSAPGTVVTLSLFEVAGGRRHGVDAVRAVLDGSAWQPLVGRHLVRRPGSWLGVEVVAPGLPPTASLFVDDLGIRPA